MTIVKAGTKKAQAMIWEWEHCYKGNDVEEAYGRCSSAKISSFKEIWFRAHQTEGYNHDLKVTAAGSQFYSTMYSYTREDGTYLVKDTYCNTYITKIA